MGTPENGKACRAYYKMQKRCLRCHSRDHRTERGLTLCADCAEKDSNRIRHYSEEQKERHKQNQLERYAMARAEGRCTMCGKPSDRPNRSTCSICGARECARKREARSRRPGPHRGDEGQCYRCLKNPVAEGYKLCQSCLEQSREAWKKVPSPSKEHPWRQLWTKQSRRCSRS